MFIDIIIKVFSIKYIKNLPGIEPVNFQLLNYTSRPEQKEHNNPAKNQVSHNTKIESRKRKQKIKTTN
jgi:hypothetical protein